MALPELQSTSVVAIQRFHRFARAFLVYTIAVIVWGAFVRASLSGDGCGAHWPLCNGDVIPASPSQKTVIEFTHRITSGLCWVGALVLALWARRAFEAPHLVRRFALLSFVFMSTEALVGAAIVLLRMVADNPAVARGYWMAAHLVNTFLLLFFLGLTVWASSDERNPVPTPTSLRTRMRVALGLLLVVAMFGAIAALGDTLFPARSLAHGFEQDLSPTAHLFIQLRAIHPVAAIIVSSLLWIIANLCIDRHPESQVLNAAKFLKIFLLVQLAIGFSNWALLAPVWLQLTHLVVADFLWISATILYANVSFVRR
ncbi:MAG: COX15/CtaA family protein [Polyangiales bacterium]